MKFLQRVLVNMHKTQRIGAGKTYISGFLWITQRKQLVESPFDALDPLLLVLLRGREGQSCDVRPAISKIEVKEPQIREEQRDICPHCLC